MNYHLLVYHSKEKRLDYYEFTPEMTYHHDNGIELDIGALPEYSEDRPSLLSALAGVNRQRLGDITVTQGLQEGENGVYWLTYRGDKSDAQNQLYHAINDTWIQKQAAIEEERHQHQKAILAQIKGVSHA